MSYSPERHFLFFFQEQNALIFCITFVSVHLFITKLRTQLFYTTLGVLILNELRPPGFNSVLLYLFVYLFPVFQVIRGFQIELQ